MTDKTNDVPVTANCNMALRSEVFAALRRHNVSEQCFAEIAAITHAGLTSQPAPGDLDAAIERMNAVDIGDDECLRDFFSQNCIHRIAQAALSAHHGEGEPVAIVGKDYALHWASADPLSEICGRTGIRVGTPLYAHPAPTTAQPDRERKRLTDSEGQRELALLYNFADDDSRQFTRWQMLTAIQHGFSLAQAPEQSDTQSDGVGEAVLAERERCAKIVQARIDERFEEHGIVELDTNYAYYPGTAGETYEALDEEAEEIIKAIRAATDGEVG